MPNRHKNTVRAQNQSRETSFIHALITRVSCCLGMDEPDKKNLKEVTIPVKGMHCKACVELIEFKVGQLNGVSYVKAHLAEDKAVVKFDPRKVGLAELKSEIDSLGYSTHHGKKCNNLLQGITYGLLPHAGCIAFIIASILGVTVAMNFFRPLLMSPFIFHGLVLMSLVFATISSTMYLRKNGLLSWWGIQKKWKYLSLMYGSTIGINLFLFMVGFPLLANVNLAASEATASGSASALLLQVDIPCPGHAPLISGDLRSISGVTDVRFSSPDRFDVRYDPARTSEKELLSLEVFKTYKATVLERTGFDRQVLPVSGNRQSNANPEPASSSGSCGKECCGG